MNLRFIEPDWPAPPGIRAASTLRAGGASTDPYRSLNLGLHVGDEPARVSENRNRLAASLALPSTPEWLTQVHGNLAVDAATTGAPEADAGYTHESGVVCTVMTADCLPILLCKRDGCGIAAVHAGWKGLENGIVEASIDALGTPKLLAWLGPAIGPEAFEVGAEVRESFLAKSGDYTTAFCATDQGKYLADIYQLGRTTLMLAGVNVADIYGGGWCTYQQSKDFFSYRRDHITGRMATLIWRE
jgi:YfiH family protein